MLLLLPVLGATVDQEPRNPASASAIVESEIVFHTAPFASAHASTIVETAHGFVVAWFGGSREGAADVGIWLSRRVKGEWTPPVEVANGVGPDGTRHPCWNPVLFEMTARELWLFYKVGPSPQRWWGMVRTSRDSGRTWSDARRLPDGILGPIKNKPVRLSDGSIVSGSSTESPAFVTASAGTPGSGNASAGKPESTWRVHFERSIDAGRTWTVARPRASETQREIDAIQPSILVHPRELLQAIGRSRSGRVFETWSSDRGQTWTPLTLTALPNPNSGIDAVTLRDGRQLIVYNHTREGRSPLNVALSRDGRSWDAALVLERDPGEYSYPAVIQAADGRVHITYTWRRQRIKHVAIDPVKLDAVPMRDGTWPRQ